MLRDAGPSDEPGQYGLHGVVGLDGIRRHPEGKDTELRYHADVVLTNLQVLITRSVCPKTKFNLFPGFEEQGEGCWGHVTPR